MSAQPPPLGTYRGSVHEVDGVGPGIPHAAGSPVGPSGPSGPVAPARAGQQPRGAADVDGVRVGQRFVIPAGELQWRFSASGGPGGQHVNTSNTRAELTYDIAKSAILGPRQRARLVERFGDALRVVAADERSQSRNRELAMQRLAGRLEEALREQRPRRPTAPPRAARQRRLRDKRQRSELKESRRLGPGED